MQLNALQLKQKIDQLEELYQKVIEEIFSDDLDTTPNIDAYKAKKKEILLSLFENPIHIMDSKYFSDVRKNLQRLTLNGDPFLPEVIGDDEKKADAIRLIKKLLEVELTPEEYKKYGEKYFYEWFSGEEYAEALIKSQLLILRTGKIPKELRHFADEIRSCYAFQKYTAAFTLCRTLLEISVVNIFESNKLHLYDTPFAEPTIEYYESKNSDKAIDKFDPNLFDRIKILAKLPKFENLESQLHDVRILGNSIIHGNRVATYRTATDMIQKTFNVIHNLYEAN